jgi:excisionase family DNA binding protein
MRRYDLCTQESVALNLFTRVPTVGSLTLMASAAPTELPTPIKLPHNRKSATFNLMAAAAESETSLADRVLEFETAITVQQLATILQCSRGQIYKLIDEKRLPALKVGTLVRLDPTQVADWIRSKMTIAVVN